MISAVPHAGIDDATPRSQASYAYEVIRSDILAGRHRPDAKLKVLDLSVSLGVSAGAVREALSRLVPEQLVVSREQRGFMVAPLSVTDLEDLTELRCDIEAIALRRSIALGDLEWEANLIAAAHRLRLTPLLAQDAAQTLDKAWVAAHATFHHALVAAAGSRRLLTLHAQLYEQSERYRGLSAHSEERRDVGTEHGEIVDLVLARKTTEAIIAVNEHIRETTRLIIANALTDMGRGTLDEAMNAPSG